MNKKSKLSKLICILFATIMVFSIMPNTVFAEETSDTIDINDYKYVYNNDNFKVTFTSSTDDKDGGYIDDEETMKIESIGSYAINKVVLTVGRYSCNSNLISTTKGTLSGNVQNSSSITCSEINDREVSFNMTTDNELFIKQIKIYYEKSSITIDTQSTALIYGTASSATYDVTLAGVTEPDNFTVAWYDKDDQSISTPTGVTTSYNKNTDKLTVNTTAATPAGTYKFTLTSGGVTSDKATLAICNPNIVIDGTSELTAGYSDTAYAGVDGTKLEIGVNEIKSISTGDNGVANTAYGIKNESSNVLTIGSLTDGIDVKSSNGTAYGVFSGSSGKTNVYNLKDINIQAAASGYGIRNFDTNETYVSFVNGGKMDINGGTDKTFGLRTTYGGKTTVTNLSEMKIEGAGYASGINSESSSTSLVSFKGNGKQPQQAIIVTGSPAYSINRSGTGTTTVSFENSILSGKIQQKDSSTLTLNFNDKGIWTPASGDVSGNVNVNVNSGGSIDTRTRDDNDKVTTAAAKTISLGTGELTAASGSKISFDVDITGDSVNSDKISAGKISGTIAIDDINITGTDTNWNVGEFRTCALFNATDITGLTITGSKEVEKGGYVYVFEPSSTKGALKVTKKKSVTVTFDVQGHGTAPDNQNVLCGPFGNVEKPDDPTASGYLFDGWYKEASCTNKWDFSKDQINSITSTSLTLYAKWLTKVTVPTPANNLVYNGSSQAGVIALTGAKYGITGTNTATDVGNYTATATLTDKENYVWDLTIPTSEDQTISWKIDKKEIKITADNKTSIVGSDLATLTYTRDTATTLCGSDTLSGELTTTAKKATAGTYDITQGTLTAGNNYKITFTNGKYIVCPNVNSNKSNVTINGNKLSTSLTKGSTSDRNIDFDMSIADDSTIGHVNLVKNQDDTYSNTDGTNTRIQITSGQNTIDPSNYVITSGSIKISLKKAYLDTLAAGTHDYQISIKDNADITYTYDLSVTINNPTSSSDTAYKVVKTGVDGTNNTIKLVSLLSLVTIAGVVTLKKRKH